MWCNLCNWRFIAVAMLLFGLSFAASCHELALPPGWRMPTAGDLGDAWRDQDAGRNAVVIGDFNGDGIEDRALLLVAKTKRKFALFAFVHQANGSKNAYPLNVDGNIANLSVMGISKLSPGKYATACGKGYWKCKPGESAEIIIKNDAINYFKVESANSYFYWDAQSNRFKRIWVSD